MSIQSAVKFITKVDSDNEFRKDCYKNKSRQELLDYLKMQGFSFTEDEIENTFNMLLFKCQTYEQAENVRHLQSWFSLFK